MCPLTHAILTFAIPPLSPSPLPPTSPVYYVHNNYVHIIIQSCPQDCGPCPCDSNEDCSCTAEDDANCTHPGLRGKAYCCRSDTGREQQGNELGLFTLAECNRVQCAGIMMLLNVSE